MNFSVLNDSIVQNTTSVMEYTASDAHIQIATSTGMPVLNDTPFSHATTMVSDVTPRDTTAWTNFTAGSDLPTTTAGGATEVVVELDALNLSLVSSLTPTVLYLATLMVVGCLGNSVVLAVYYRRFKPSSTRSYVLAMSVADLTTSVLCLSGEVVDLRYTYTFPCPWLCRATRFLNSFFSLVSAFVLVAVARDRCRKICHPLERPQSRRRVNVNILACCAASLCLSVPFGALNGSHSLPTGYANVTGVTCSVDDALRDSLFPMLYNLVMSLAFVLCVGVMVASYGAIALTLWRHRKTSSLQSTARKPRVKRPARSADDSSKQTSSSFMDSSTSGGGALSSDNSSWKQESCAVCEDIPMAGVGGGKVSKSFRTKPTGGIIVPSHSVTISVLKNVQLKEVPDKEPDVEGVGNVLMESDKCDVYKPPNDQDSNAPGDSRFVEVDLQNEHSHSVDTPESAARGDNSGPTGGRTRGPDPDGDSEDGPPAVATATSRDDVESEPESSSVYSDDGEATRGVHVDRPLVLVRGRPSHKLSQPLLTRFLELRKRQQYKVTSIDSRPTGSSGLAFSSSSPARRGNVKKIPTSTTFMMFVLTATFIVNYLPHLIIIIIRAIIDVEAGLTGGGVLNAYNIALRSYYMNCAVNSLVYGFCNARFRMECRNFICRRR